MEYVGVDAVEPRWKSMDQFVVHELQGVFTLDALSTSHKIWVEVGNPEEINDIFDRISYGKGATIIRMMDHFLTTAVFRTGLTNYLRKKYYHLTEIPYRFNKCLFYRPVGHIRRLHKMIYGISSPKRLVTRTFLTIQCQSRKLWTRGRCKQVSQ